MNIINDLRRIKRLLKVTYYWMLCFFLSPKSKGSEPYKNEPLKYRLTKLIPGSKNSAVHLQITGKVTGVGFRAWLIRRARLNKLEGLAINRSKKRVEAVLIGSSSSIVKVIQEAWKGPPKAKVAKVKVKWFNMPVKRHLEGSSTNNQDINWSVETAELLRLNIDCLGAVMQNPNIFTEDEVYSNSGELAKAARKKNLFVAQLGNINYMVSPVKKLGFHQSQSSGVTTAIRSLTDNKQLTRKHLFKHGFPVPEGEMFTDYQPAQDYFFSCAKPVVVKPATGSYGKGITVDVTSIEDFETAWEHAKSYHSQVVIEKMFQGVDIRILVLGGKATAALMRVPAHVIGDGINTIESLIDSKNEVRMANPRLCKAPIAPDLHTESFLSRQGHSFSSVPYKGEVVFLNLKANIGAGADSVIVTDRIHQDLMSLAEKAVKTFGINHFWGVDMLVERIHRPRNEQRCVIIEVNSRANIYNVRFPIYGKPYDAASDLMSRLFPENAEEHSYPLDQMQIEVNLNDDDKNFIDWVYKKGQELNLKGLIAPLDDGIYIVAASRQKRLLTFLYNLWMFKDNKKRVIDRLAVSSYQGSVNEDFVRKNSSVCNNISDKNKKEDLNFDHIMTNNFDYKKSVERISEDLDVQLFFDELNNQGYHAQKINEELLEISKGNLKGFTGMRFSSVFCDIACDRLYPAKMILAMNKLPVLRGIRYKSAQLNKAIKYLKSLQKPALFHTIHPDKTNSFAVINAKELTSIWYEAVRKGCKTFVIEEVPQGWTVRVAVVSGKAVGALIVQPIEVVGDGTSTISALIEIKNKVRKANPYYRFKLISNGPVLIKQLKNQGCDLDTIPAIGKPVILESEAVMEFGGETLSFFDELNESFKEFAEQAVKAIPGLEFAVVDLIVPIPYKSKKTQNWAVKRINTRPDVAEFHFPWKGEPCDLTKIIVDNLFLPALII